MATLVALVETGKAVGYTGKALGYTGKALGFTGKALRHTGKALGYTGKELQAWCTGMSSPSKQFFLGLIAGLSVTFLLYCYVYLNYSEPVHPVQLLTNVVRADQANNKLVSQADSHEAFDQSVARTSLSDVHLAEDQHMHHDDDELAKTLAQKVRVLVWVMTNPNNLDKKARGVKETWGKRCNKLIFFSSETNNDFPTIGLDVDEGREHLTAKTMRGFRYVYEHFMDDADWFMKADDDTYVILENLRYFLSEQNTSEPIYFGHHFKTHVKQGYYSGGGGYVLSKEALRRLRELGNDSSVCRQDGGSEDVEIGKCLQTFGVRTANSTDALGRSRFHCFDPETHLFGGYPDWYYQYDANGAQK
ncbi:Glycoprotein-N-acetylgalactosamine 3-beta-galactosyltransferase 1, partial [Bulinus truncatus]